MKPTISQLFSETERLTSALKSSLPSTADPRAVSTVAKLPFKVLTLREVLLYRISELSNSAIRLFKSKDCVAAIVLVRSSLETTTVLYKIYSEIETFNRSKKNIENTDLVLTRLLFGTNDNKTTDIHPIEIGKLIDAANIIFPGIKEHYRLLCGYAHPNYHGTLHAYGEFDKDKWLLKLSNYGVDRKLTIGLNSLHSTIQLFHHYYNALPEVLEVFAKNCEDQITAKRQPPNTGDSR